MTRINLVILTVSIVLYDKKDSYASLRLLNEKSIPLFFASLSLVWNVLNCFLWNLIIDPFAARDAWFTKSLPVRNQSSPFLRCSSPHHHHTHSAFGGAFSPIHFWLIILLIESGRCSTRPLLHRLRCRESVLLEIVFMCGGWWTVCSIVWLCRVNFKTLMHMYVKIFGLIS
jgi:hypothetical protein